MSNTLINKIIDTVISSPHDNVNIVYNYEKLEGSSIPAKQGQFLKF